MAQEQSRRDKRNSGRKDPQLVEQAVKLRGRGRGCGHPWCSGRDEAAI